MSVQSVSPKLKYPLPAPEPGLTSSYEFLSSFNRDAAELSVTESGALAVPLLRIAKEKVAEAAAKLP